MNDKIKPQDQAFWYVKREQTIPLRENLAVDVVIIGGGMAGLSAAHAAVNKGKRVVLLEHYYCGSGATGKSSGFITPNAELSFTDYAKRFSFEDARIIWDCINSGVNDIRSAVTHYNFDCEYMPQDTLVIANTKKAMQQLTTEYNNLTRYNYKTALYDKNNICNSIGSSRYYGGVGYKDTFSINGYLYCQEMKKVLLSKGVQIFEETAVVAISDHIVQSLHGSVEAEYIIVCTDRFAPQMGLLKQDVYHAQTFLMLSEPLTEEQARRLFPRKSLLVWDTELIYNYFRLTIDNRLLLGGGCLLNTYARTPTHDSSYMFNKLTRYFAKMFPDQSIQFSHMWPGLIGISKDIAPIIGRDKDKQHIYYVSAATGLPIAAALGRYAVEHLLDGRNELDDYFSPYRSVPIGGIVQKILGTPFTFALCNGLKTNIP